VTTKLGLDLDGLQKKRIFRAVSNLW